MLFCGERVVNELFVREERRHRSLFSLLVFFPSSFSPVFPEEVLKYFYATWGDYRLECSEF